MNKVIFCLSVLAIAAPIQAGTKARPKVNTARPEEVIVTMDAKPDIIDPSAPERPEGTRNESDKFVTRKDAHGHDYDVRTGNVICLDKPFLFKNSLYGSASPRKIPLGHSMCISSDRQFTTI